MIANLVEGNRWHPYIRYVGLTSTGRQCPAMLSSIWSPHYLTAAANLVRKTFLDLDGFEIPLLYNGREDAAGGL